MRDIAEPVESPRGNSWLIGAVVFAACAFFQPGGGLNQNVRFDQVRSLVETGSWDIDDYTLYRPDVRHGEPHVRRISGFHPAALPKSPPYPNSCDLSYFGGHIYPNKPPGTTLLAAPAYAIVHSIQRAIGADTDDIWPMTIALWVCTIGSSSLMAALGAVVFWHVVRRLFPDARPLAHLGAALAFAFGTLMLPFGTMMFDHVPVATLLLAVFALLQGPQSPGRVVVAALLGGLAVVTNYTAAVIAAIVFGFALLERIEWALSREQSADEDGARLRSAARRSTTNVVGSEMARRSASEIGRTSVPAVVARELARLGVPSGMGAALPVAFLLWYHRHCFGGMLTPSYKYQTEGFLEHDERFLRMFAGVDWQVLWRILIHPHWGLLPMCPVVVMALVGLCLMRRGRQRAVAMLIAIIFIVVVVINTSFNGWHGGYSVGPRYLIPAIPFLCLALVPAFQRLPRLTTGAAIISVAIMFLAVIVHPLLPMTADHPIRDFWLPLLAGRTIAVEDAVFEGPVSAGPRGVYDWGFPPLFGPGTEPARWNAFNAGEFLHPGSVWSLWPLGVFLAIALTLLIQMARRESASRVATAAT